MSTIYQSENMACSATPWSTCDYYEHYVQKDIIYGVCLGLFLHLGQDEVIVRHFGITRFIEFSYYRIHCRS